MTLLRLGTKGYARNEGVHSERPLGFRPTDSEPFHMLEGGSGSGSGSGSDSDAYPYPYP